MELSQSVSRAQQAVTTTTLQSGKIKLNLPWKARTYVWSDQGTRDGDSDSDIVTLGDDSDGRGVGGGL